MLYAELKEYRILVTFDSMGQAFGAERVLKRNNCPSALIPTPTSLRSGCNSSVCFPMERKELVDELVDEGVRFTGIYEAMEDGFEPLKW